jgi:hypothetical protein
LGKRVVETIFHQHGVSLYDAVGGVGDFDFHAVDVGLVIELTAKTQGRKDYV